MITCRVVTRVLKCRETNLTTFLLFRTLKDIPCKEEGKIFGNTHMLGMIKLLLNYFALQKLRREVFIIISG